MDCANYWDFVERMREDIKFPQMVEMCRLTSWTNTSPRILFSIPATFPNSETEEVGQKD